MVEQDKQNKPTGNIVDLWPETSKRSFSWLNLLPPEERERLATQEILREVEHQYEPIDEHRIRIIDIQRRIARVPHWEHFITNILAKVGEKVSNLEKQVGQLASAVRDTSKIYNATIYELGTSKYELSMPIQIVLEEDQEETVARIPELNLYASGDTDAEAINELKEEVVNLYEDLLSSDKTLGPLPKSWLDTLNRLIVKKNGQD